MIVSDVFGPQLQSIRVSCIARQVTLGDLKAGSRTHGARNSTLPLEGDIKYRLERKSDFADPLIY